MDCSGDLRRILYTEDESFIFKDGTCLLAFPPARTGNYKVPSHVTEIADGAFDRAGISVLDASDCSFRNQEFAVLY